MSPDGSKRAVFAILAADGSLVQGHTEFALDGLAPPGTVTPIAVPPPATASATMMTRAGMIFNWVPERILYVTDAKRNAVVALTLTSDEKIFRVRDNRTFATRIERTGRSCSLGAGDYIGGEIAKKFASQGFTIFAGRRDGAKLEPLVKDIIWWGKFGLSDDSFSLSTFLELIENRVTRPNRRGHAEWRE